MRSNCEDFLCDLGHRLTASSTQYSDFRQITLQLSASNQNPAETDDAQVYFMAGQKQGTESVDPDQTPKVYLVFAVRDTGCGLNAQERLKMFMRFSQANQRTHVQYGVRRSNSQSHKKLTVVSGKRPRTFHMQRNSRALWWSDRCLISAQ